jgi:4'-phosphopantetheinyl transferase EntD
LFCAKETVYKAWFPLTHSWLGFEDAAVTISPGASDSAEGTFSAHLLVAAPAISSETPTHFKGRWLRNNELVITTIALSADSPCRQ